MINNYIIKKAAFMVVAYATVASVALAAEQKTEFGSETPEDWTTFDTWFNGDGDKTPVNPTDDKLTATGGSWNPANGVWHANDRGDRFTSTTFGLEFATNFTFTGERNQTVTYGGLFYTTKAKFRYSYSSEEELPEIEEGAKVGAVVCNDKYWVLGKNGSENEWTDTGISVDDVDSDVEISISLTNNASATFATYKFGTSEYNTEIVAADTALRTVRYAGCGKITTLNSKAGDYYPLFSVARGVRKSDAWAWAQKYDITSDHTVSDVKKDKTLHDLLNSEEVYANGLTAGESCLIGINTNQVVTSSIDDDQVLASKLEFSMPSVSGLVSRAEFILKKDVGVAGGTETAMTQQVYRVFKPGFAYGIYTIHARIDGGRPNNEPQFGRKMGVKPALGTLTEAKSGSFCEVPYEGVNEGEPIKIADIFKKDLLVEGDQIHVFDSESEKWKVFQYCRDGKDGYWQGVPMAGESEIHIGTAPSAQNTTIRRGEAFKFIRPNAILANKQATYLGYVSDEPASIELPYYKYVLVSMSDSYPYGNSKFQINKLEGNDFVAYKHTAFDASPCEEYRYLFGRLLKFEYANGTSVGSFDPTEIDGPFFLMNNNSLADSLSVNLKGMSYQGDNANK